MSCDGCIYNSKKAGCDFSYPCNTTGIPIKKIVAEESKRDKKKKGSAGK